MKQRFLSFLLASVMAVSAAVPVQAADRFTDVPKNSWAYSAIEQMAEAGIVSGKGDGKFDPDGSVTKAQFISMLMRMSYGKELAKDSKTYSIWYGKALEHAEANGLLFKLDIANTKKAMGAERWDKAEANAPISREEAAVLLYNHLKQTVALPDENKLRTVTAAKIPDLGSSDVLEQFAIASVYELGILSGTDKNGTFAAEDVMTRAQACVVLSRMQALKQTSYAGADWVKQLESGRLTKVLKAELLANGREATEANVAASLQEMRSKYPHGMSCTNANFHYIDPKTGKDTGNGGCYALMMYLFDHVFGYRSYAKAEKTALTAETFADIKVGDHIRMENLPHSVVVLEKHSSYVKVVEGNYNKKVSWGNTYSKQELLSHKNVWVYSCY